MSAIHLGLDTTTTATPALDLQPLCPDDEVELSTVHEDEDGDEPEDYTGHSVHAEGVPQCETTLVARNFRSSEFAQTVFNMFKRELRLEGWTDLADSLQASVLIQKVGGCLTNAVFFVSCPLRPPTPDADSTDRRDPEARPPPTILLRIYGPSSSSLISRKHELHLLHTLSVQYGIGPLVLGTFHNGRAEQYFDSRPLTKNEMREPGISRWIARRMRELHSVDLRTLSAAHPITATDEETRSDSSARSSYFRSISHPGPGQTSCAINNSSKTPSQRLWSSGYSSSSDVSAIICPDQFSISSPSAYSTIPPNLTTHEARSLGKKRSRDSMRSNSVGSLKPNKIKIGAWENITRWQREADKVITLITKAFERHAASKPPSPPTTPTLTPTGPLKSPATLLAFVQHLDLPRLVQEIKAYRKWVRELERANGKSPRVFCHNDTQYGNLLLRELDEPLYKDRAHEQILVIDFEYACANPRAFDIANHFHEWCTDYHHPSYSYSLTHHNPYPTVNDRHRFYRAYLYQPDPAQSATLDGAVNRLDEEVRIWSPASHAMWALWGIVQAQDDVKDRLSNWDEELSVEFDYLSYSLERVLLFRSLVKELGAC